MEFRSESLSAARSFREPDGVEPSRRFFPRIFVTDFTFRLRYLGFGLYWAWMTTFWSGALRSPLGMSSIDQTTTARIGVQVATAVGFVLAALFARRLTTSPGERLLVLTGAILGPLGTIVATLGRGHDQGGPPAYLILSWVFLGVACASITLLWGRFYASVGLKNASLLAPLSLVLASVAGLLLASMQPLAALVITTLLPLASVGMFLLVAPEVASSQKLKEADHSQSLGALWRIVAAIGVYGATLGFYLHSQTLFPQNNGSSATSRLVVLVIPLLIIGLLRRNDFGLVFRIALPLTAAGFLLLPILGMNAGWIGAAVVAAGGTFADILTWIALSDIAHRSSRSPILVFGVGRAANAGGIALGWAASYALLGTVTAQPSLVLGFSLTMVFVLILTTSLILKDEDFTTEPRTAGAGTTAEAAAPGTDETRHGPGRWRRSCATIAREHKLSPREEQVLVLLAKGRSMKHIEEALVISYHTAKAHANHIYRKLDVHSREELIDLVERNKSCEPPLSEEEAVGVGLVSDGLGRRREGVAGPLTAQADYARTRGPI